MNAQDVLRDVHDAANHQLKVGATVNSNSTVFIGTPTLYAIVNTAAAGQASIVLDNSISRIGFATVAISTPTLFAVVNTAAAGQASVVLDTGTRQIGSVTVSNPITIASSVNNIGFATVFQASSARTITGNITLSNPNTYIGLTTSTLGAGTQFIGLTTVVQANSARSIVGNLTLSDAKTYIGLVTNTPSWGSEATVYATTISSTGNTTLFIAPASNRFFIKDLHVSSLGRSEIQFLSGATVFIPLTSLATNSGFATFYGEMGKPGRAAADALVANLNGGATVSIGVTYRIAP